MKFGGDAMGLGASGAWYKPLCDKGLRLVKA
jgi:hypothetical protein